MRVKRHCLPIAAICCAVFNHGAHAQLANSPWPMFRHDERHTGRGQYKGPRNCKLAWSYATADLIHSSPTIGPDGRVYVGSYDHCLYALDSNGALAWSYETGPHLIESSPAIDSEGMVYVGSADNCFYAFDSNGALAWSYDTSHLIASSAALDSDGVIYTGSSIYLYAFTSCHRSDQNQPLAVTSKPASVCLDNHPSLVDLQARSFSL